MNEFVPAWKELITCIEKKVWVKENKAWRNESRPNSGLFNLENVTEKKAVLAVCYYFLILLIG